MKERLSIEHKEIFDKYTRLYRGGGLGYECDFATLFCWDAVNKTHVTEYADFILIDFGGDKRARFLIPKKGLSEAELIDAAEARSSGGTYIWVGADAAGALDTARYAVKPAPEAFDYIYDTEELVSLQGKKFHAKRNHLNKFESLYSYVFRDCTDADFNAVTDLFKKWESGAGVSKESASAEYSAIVRALENRARLGLNAAVLEIDGGVRAFSVCSVMPCGAGHVLFEKGDIGYDGIYAAVNNYAVKKYLSETKFINREEDMGIEGLKKSKLSYNPVMLLEKYEVRKR